jgi:hypothetical protein
MFRFLNIKDIPTSTGNTDKMIFLIMIFVFHGAMMKGKRDECRSIEGIPVFPFAVCSNSSIHVHSTKGKKTIATTKPRLGHLAPALEVAGGYTVPF